MSEDRPMLLERGLRLRDGGSLNYNIGAQILIILRFFGNSVLAAFSIYQISVFCC